MSILIVVVVVVVLAVVGMIVLGRPRGGVGGGSIGAMFFGFALGLLITGVVWLLMDAERSITRTHVVRAVGQLDELVRAGDCAACGDALAAGRVDLEGGLDAINALGRLSGTLLKRRQALGLVDENGRAIVPAGGP